MMINSELENSEADSTEPTRAPLVLNKAEVRRAFGDAASRYDAAAALQREVCNRTLEKLDLIKIEPTHIVDLGCGTGYGTNLLAKRFPKSRITGVDIAQPMVDAMLAHCKGTTTLATKLKQTFKRSLIAGVCTDAEATGLPTMDCEFVFSTFALHWCDTLVALKEAHRLLKPGGLILIAVPGPDTLRELKSAFTAADEGNEKVHVNQFIDMHDLGDMLVQAGFADPVVDMEHITVTYSNVRDVLTDLKAIGASNHMNARERGLMGKIRWQKMQTAYEQFRDVETGKLPATYEVVYAHSWKPLQLKKIADGRSVVRFEGYKRADEQGYKRAG
jgi:malonyl-CoA O-methyltransferase